MIWRKPQDYYDNYCYFWVFDLVGVNKRTKTSTTFSYPSLKSVIHPASHFGDMTISVFKESVLSDTEPSKHHEETSYSSNMNQGEIFF